MGKTKIEWTHGFEGRPGATWNPVRGCSLVSAGCTNCYAMRQAHRQKNGAYKGLTRLGANGPVWTGDVRVVPEMMDYPLRLRKPHMIFVNSMSDLFHESLSDESIDRIFAVMGNCSEERGHVFQVLTKRPARMLEYMNTRAREAWNGPRMNRSSFPPNNIWLGVSVENQETADERISLLMETPAAVRWISAEPLLGLIDLESVPTMEGSIDWVVVGGESGPNARPMHPDWARSLRDQCVAAGVPFFFKQWGEYKPLGSVFNRSDTMFPLAAGLADERKSIAVDGQGTVYWNEGDEPPVPQRAADAYVMSRVGKANAGRLIDGREWNEYPVSQGVVV